MKNFLSNYRIGRFWVTTGCLLLTGLSVTYAAWVNATGNLAGMATECGTIQGSPFAVPNANKVIAGVSNVGLFATSDGGVNWAKISGNLITARPTHMLFDPDHPNTWWYSGIYHAPAVFKTTDAGATWTALGQTPTHDGMSVDFSDPERKTLLGGAHEQTKRLWKSTDGGLNWTDIGDKLPADGASLFPHVISSQTYVMGLADANGGVYLSTDGGNTWSKKWSGGVRTNFTRASDGTIYCIGGSGGAISGSKVIKSTDGSNWTTIINSNVYAAPPIELPNHSIAVIASGGIAISADKGATWKTVAGPLPSAFTGNWYTAWQTSLAYNSVAGAFYIGSFSCQNTVKSDELWRYDTLIGATTGTLRTPPVFRSVKIKSRAEGMVDIRGRSIRNFASHGSTRVYAVCADGRILFRGIR